MPDENETPPRITHMHIHDPSAGPPLKDGRIDPVYRRVRGKDDVAQATVSHTEETDAQRADRFERLYKATAIALCKLRGIPPFETFPGTNLPNWHIIGDEAAAIEQQEQKHG